MRRRGSRTTRDPESDRRHAPAASHGRPRPLPIAASAVRRDRASVGRWRRHGSARPDVGSQPRRRPRLEASAPAVAPDRPRPRCERLLSADARCRRRSADDQDDPSRPAARSAESTSTTGCCRSTPRRPTYAAAIGGWVAARRRGPDRHRRRARAAARTNARGRGRPRPSRGVGRYACRIEQGRAAMWWTVDDRGLLAHAIAADADLGVAVRVVGVALRALNRRDPAPSLTGCVRLWYVPHGSGRRTRECRWRSSARTDSGASFVAAHVIVAVMWMGLLWFFNFVQTPAYAEMEPAARNNAFDKLTWRALWWFRWAAMATVVIGVLDHRGRGQRHVQRRLLEVDARRDAADRHPVGVHDALQRVDDHLAEPADRHRQRPQGAARRRGRPQRAGRGPRRCDGVPSEHDLLAARALLHGRASHFYG